MDLSLSITLPNPNPSFPELSLASQFNHSRSTPLVTRIMLVNGVPVVSPETLAADRHSPPPPPDVPLLSDQFQNLCSLNDQKGVEIPRNQHHSSPNSLVSVATELSLGDTKSRTHHRAQVPAPKKYRNFGSYYDLFTYRSPTSIKADLLKLTLFAS